MKSLRLMTDKVDSLEAIDLEDLCVGRALKNTRSVILMGTAGWPVSGSQATYRQDQ